MIAYSAPPTFFYWDRWLKTIHYSWFTKYFSSFPSSLIPYFLALFPPQEREKLSSLLETQPAPTSPFLYPYLASLLKEKIPKTEPLEFLTPAPLSFLLEMKKERLTLLIDLLGIFDLAYDIKKVVNKELLNKIFASLSKEQLSFLEWARKQEVRWIPPSLHLNSWDGNPSVLKKELHARGVRRLAIATLKESEGFKWHLIHLLDIGRGERLQGFYKETMDANLIPYFQEQLLSLSKKI